MYSDHDLLWNWQSGKPQPPNPRGERGPSKEHSYWDPKQPFGTMFLPPEPNLGRKTGLLKALKWSVPVVAVMATIGLWITVLFLWTGCVRSHVQEGNFTYAVAQYERQRTLTSVFPQPWLAKYNLGTALLLENDLEGGVEHLWGALKGVPKAVKNERGTIQPFSYECAVRTNLSAGIEMQGDEIAGPLDGETVDSAATELYERALEIISPCEVQPQPSEGEDADQDHSEGDPEDQNEGLIEELDLDGNEAGDRLREKLGQSQEGDDEDSSGEGKSEGNEDSNFKKTPDPFEGETENERERREELEKHNREHSERQREKEEYWNRNPGSGGW